MKLNFEFDGHKVEMEYTYRKGTPAPRVVNERTYLTPPDQGEFEVHSLKVDGEEKDIDISEEYLLEQAEEAERDAEIAMQEIRYDAYREELCQK
jgi:hypothetical protein